MQKDSPLLLPLQSGDPGSFGRSLPLLPPQLLLLGPKALLLLLLSKPFLFLRVFLSLQGSLLRGDALGLGLGGKVTISVLATGEVMPLCKLHLGLCFFASPFFFTSVFLCFFLSLTGSVACQMGFSGTVSQGESSTACSADLFRGGSGLFLSSFLC